MFSTVFASCWGRHLYKKQTNKKAWYNGHCKPQTEYREESVVYQRLYIMERQATKALVHNCNMYLVMCTVVSLWFESDMRCEQVIYKKSVLQ